MSSNGIAAERPRPDDLEPRNGSTRVVSVGRNLNGSWTLVLDADYRFRLPDGRELVFVGELRLKGHQRGRKPREARS